MRATGCPRAPRWWPLLYGITVKSLFCNLYFEECNCPPALWKNKKMLLYCIWKQTLLNRTHFFAWWALRANVSIRSRQTLQRNTTEWYSNLLMKKRKMHVLRFHKWSLKTNLQSSASSDTNRTLRTLLKNQIQSVKYSECYCTKMLLYMNCRSEVSLTLSPLTPGVPHSPCSP